MLMYLLALEFCQCIRFCINNETYSWEDITLRQRPSASEHALTRLTGFQLMASFTCPTRPAESLSGAGGTARYWDIPDQNTQTLLPRAGAGRNTIFLNSTSSTFKMMILSSLYHGRLGLLMGSWVEVTSGSRCKSILPLTKHVTVSDQDKTDTWAPLSQEIFLCWFLPFTSSCWK